MSFFLKKLFLGKTKCMSKTGDCVVKHPTNFTTGFAMVVSVSCVLSVFLAVLEQLEIEQVCL